MTVTMAAVVAALVVVCWGGAAMASAIVASGRADAAADLAALAGAAAGGQVGGPCAVAASVAAANGATLTECDRGPGGEVTIDVAVPVTLALPGLESAAGRARAGPAPASRRREPGREWRR